MPRSNPSRVSNSRANSTRFRERDLLRAGVVFHYDLTGAPEHLSLLCSRLNEVSEQLESCFSHEKLEHHFSRPNSSSPEEREAYARLAHPSGDAIRRCRLKHERR